MDIPAMFRGAVAEFGARVRQIGDHQWQAATPDGTGTSATWSIMLPARDLWAGVMAAGSGCVMLWPATGRQEICRFGTDVYISA
jgi:hypothetical protein